MLTRTRISGKMDTGRLGQAVARPGIDPRAWVSLAVALDESKVDPSYGVFVNVQLMPTGEKYTASVLAQYAGKGFGLYTKILPDDDLIVAIPGGDPRLGVVVLGRMWTAADTPPTEATADPAEVMLVVEKDKNLRLKVTGTGAIELDSDATVTVKAAKDALVDSGTIATVKAAQKVILDAAKVIAKSPVVRLGDEAAVEKLVLGTTYRAQEATMDTSVIAGWLAMFTALTAAGTGLTTAGSDAVLSALAPAAAAGLVAAGAALTAAAPAAQAAQTAVKAFETAAATYLSTVSNTK